MRIQVKSVSPVTKEKSYYYFTLDYSQDGKDAKPKKIMSFAEEAYGKLKDAKGGDSFDVKLEKDNNGYWQWVTVTQVEAGADPTPGTSTGKSGNWETSEERARRQILIVRQSCLAQAVASMVNDAGGDQLVLPVETILERASNFEEWVNRE